MFWGQVTMWATIAAFTAAGLSLIGAIVSVVITAKFTRRFNRVEWLRNYVRPLAGEFLGHVDDLLFRFEKMTGREVDNPNDKDIMEFAEIKDLIRELTKISAQLKLAASPAVSDSACALDDRFREVNRQRVLDVTPPEPTNVRALKVLRAAFINAVRRDLDVPGMPAEQLEDYPL